MRSTAIGFTEQNGLEKVVDGVPIGAIIPYAGSTAPFGTLICNGAAISRSAYPELFEAIGTTWGAGDGSTTFNIPDLRGYFLRGVGGNSAGLAVEQGEIVGIVGESGSGKSQSMYSVMGLLSENGTVEDGSILFDGQEISPARFTGGAHAYEKMMEGIRGRTLSMIFQDPMSFLNPVLTIEKQLVEPMKNHLHLSGEELHRRAVQLLTQVGIPSPEERLKQYPHQLSGGMRQRVIIAIALACDPKLIIADEPTTALDVTIQAKILGLIKEMRDQTGSGVILITHDLGVVASTCSRVYIMYGGKIVENGTADEFHSIMRSHFRPYIDSEIIQKK